MGAGHWGWLMVYKPTVKRLHSCLCLLASCVDRHSKGLDKERSPPKSFKDSVLGPLFPVCSLLVRSPNFTFSQAAGHHLQTGVPYPFPTAPPNPESLLWKPQEDNSGRIIGILLNPMLICNLPLWLSGTNVLAQELQVPCEVTSNSQLLPAWPVCPEVGTTPACLGALVYEGPTGH